MTKKLTFLICTLILAGFGALAAVETPSSVPAVQPSAQVVAPDVQTSPELETFLNQLAPQTRPTAACPGGQHGPCDTNSHCRMGVGYRCPLGEVRTCVGSSGTGSCDGQCECV